MIPGPMSTSQARLWPANVEMEVVRAWTQNAHDHAPIKYVSSWGIICGSRASGTTLKYLSASKSCLNSAALSIAWRLHMFMA